MLDEDDDLDDTHLCIKCSATIHGLANYVQHRKTSCSGKHISNPIEEIQQVQHSYTSYGFPSTNVNVVVSKNQLENFPFSYDLDHHHHHHHDHDVDVEHDDGSRDAENENGVNSVSRNANATLENVNKKSVSSVTKDITAENYNFNYGLGADVFFSSLELQSSTRKGSTDGPGATTGGKVGLHNRILTRKATAAILANHGDTDPHVDDWIGGNTQSESEDKLMKAVNDISGATSGNTSSKKVETMFGLIEFHPDSPISSSDDADDEEEDFDAPPRGHTGGKWKPEHRPIDNYPAWDVRHHHWDVTDDSAIINNSSKLFKSNNNNTDELDDEFSPPPDYTKGKWVPGSKITKLEYKSDFDVKKIFNDQYWCSVCNRKLSSRIIYERHLRSNLHLKRAQPENELEEASRSFIDASLLSRRITKPSIYLNQDIYATSLQLKRTKHPTSVISEDFEKDLKELNEPSENQLDTEKLDVASKQIRKRNRFYTRCDPCRTRLPIHLFGKHLISHYHYRRMINTPEKSYAVILENMHRIVRESPFQCQPCHFYANNEEYFNRHWNSKEHLKVVTPLTGKYWCILCQFECKENNEMFEHITGEEHSEVIWVINRSVPIIIRKRIILGCKDCNKEFRYNIELRKHSTKCRPSGTGTNQYQSRFMCILCPSIVFHSRIAVQKHQGKIHQQKIYFCCPCDLKFKSPNEARYHRNSSVHKIAVFKLRNANDSFKLAKKCNICAETLPDIIRLKKHIAITHPESKHSCSLCGKEFILAQEVSRHVRDKACTFDGAENLVNIHNGNILRNKPYKCDLPVAPFTTAVAINTPDEVSPTVSTDTTTIVATTNNNTTFTLPVNNFIDTRANTTKCTNSSEMFFSIAPIVTQSCYTPKTVTSIIKTDGVNTENCKITAGTVTTNKPKSIKSVIGVDDGQTEVEVLITGVDNVNTTNQDATAATNNNKKNSPWKCKFCPFKTSSQAECIFHEILHNVQKGDILDTSTVSSAKLLECTICGKTFRKSSLRFHLRQHTNERIFKCGECLMTFTRRQNLKNHITRMHRIVEASIDITNVNADTGVNSTNNKKKRKKQTVGYGNLSRNYVCQICDKSFSKKFILKQHLYVHRNEIENHAITPVPVLSIDDVTETAIVVDTITPLTTVKTTATATATAETAAATTTAIIKIKEYKCDHDNCIFSCRSSSELKAHLLTHSTIKNYECDHHSCNYKTKTLKQLKRHKKKHLKPIDEEIVSFKHKCIHCSFKTQLIAHLKRHIRIHTGEKPYKCPHCDYASNNCENLRKHVITTARHKGKFLYKCNICEESNDNDFNTNIYKEYRLHLYKMHDIKK